jgi:NitT/TauT family transport system substrate-binding protein
MQAMAGGDIQFGYLGPGAVWMPATGRAKIVAVDSLEDGDWVVSQPGIATLADLRGKTIGYAQGTSGEMILRLALKRAGLTLQDVNPVALDASAVVPAFLSHHVDAIASWVPLVQAIKANEPSAHFLINDSAFSAQYKFPDVWVASPTEIAAHPDVVLRFLEGFARASDYRLGHTTETISLVSQQAGVPAAGLIEQNKATHWITSATLARDYADGSADHWITSLERLLSEMGELPQIEPASRFTDFSLFREAQAKAAA